MTATKVALASSALLCLGAAAYYFSKDDNEIKF